jgi:hypothetical protein
MPKLCTNGSECKFLKAAKGCKFLHPDMPVVKRRRFLPPEPPVDWRDTMGAKFYGEIMSALDQVKCSQECKSRNIGGRITGMILDGFSYDELVTISNNPEKLALTMFDALEVLEAHDGVEYVSA